MLAYAYILTTIAATKAFKLQYMFVVFGFGQLMLSVISVDFPCSPSYGVYIPQLIRFARVCSNVDDFNNRN